jgi:hypothetical protein
MFLINLFYSTQEIHKLLIQRSYGDIKVEMDIYKKKYPNSIEYLLGDEYNNLSKESKEEWDNYIKKIKNLEKILINNLLNYCKNYPQTKISKNRFINEYKEYPYRLEQNIYEVISEL